MCLLASASRRVKVSHNSRCARPIWHSVFFSLLFPRHLTTSAICISPNLSTKYYPSITFPLPLCHPTAEPHWRSLSCLLLFGLRPIHLSFSFLKHSVTIQRCAVQPRCTPILWHLLLLEVLPNVWQKQPFF